MAPQQRGSDGRRRFSAEFKREQLARIERGEITIAELSREVQIDQSVVRRWKHLIERGSTTAVAANEDVVPASELRAALQRVRELERLVGKKAMEVEILQAARDEVKKSRVGTACPNDDGPEGRRDLPRARHRTRDSLSPRDAARASPRQGRRSRGDCAGARGDPDASPVRRAARTGTRQPGF